MYRYTQQWGAIFLLYLTPTHWCIINGHQWSHCKRSEWHHIYHIDVYLMPFYNSVPSKCPITHVFKCLGSTKVMASHASWQYTRKAAPVLNMNQGDNIATVSIGIGLQIQEYRIYIHIISCTIWWVTFLLCCTGVYFLIGCCFHINNIYYSDYNIVSGNIPWLYCLYENNTQLKIIHLYSTIRKRLTK